MPAWNDKQLVQTGYIKHIGQPGELNAEDHKSGSQRWTQPSTSPKPAEHAKVQTARKPDQKAALLEPRFRLVVPPTTTTHP